LAPKLGLLFLCLLLPGLGSCGSAPQVGDLLRTDRSRADVRQLVEQRIIHAEAKRVRLQTEPLKAWPITHVPFTPELVAKRPTGDKFIPSEYVNAREVDWQCRHSMLVPVFIRRDPAKQSFSEKDLFDFAGGDCYELVAPDKKTTTYISVFNLSVDLDAAIPKDKRSERIWDGGLRSIENTHYKGYHNERTDKNEWEARGITVAEVAGYYRESFGLGHIPVLSSKRNNYYRTLLMGKHTIVVVATIGPGSASVAELGEATIPIVKALRYE
jgi:hypothetical protein